MNAATQTAIATTRLLMRWEAQSYPAVQGSRRTAVDYALSLNESPFATDYRGGLREAAITFIMAFDFTREDAGLIFDAYVEKVS